MNGTGAMKSLILLVMMLAMVSVPSLAVQSAQEEDGRHVVLIYDDSGSMWQTRDDETGEWIDTDNWKLANYALQSLAGFLDTRDELHVVRMSDPGTTDRIDLTEQARQREVNRIENWDDRGGTPVRTVDTSFEHLLNEMAVYEDREYWFIIVMDGAFNEMDPDIQAHADTYNEGYEALKATFETFSEELDDTDASFQSLFMTMESFITDNEREQMERFYNGIWSQTLGGTRLRAESEQEIVDRMAEAAALMTNRDPSGPSNLDLVDVRFSGSEAVIETRYPMRRISVLEQSVGEQPDHHVDSVEAVGTDADLRIHDAVDIESPYDEFQIRDDIFGRVTHLVPEQLGAVIPPGTYELTFTEPVDSSSVELIAEPALDMEMTIKHVTPGGELVDDSERFFAGTDMKLIVRVVEDSAERERVTFASEEEAGEVELDAIMNDQPVGLQWDMDLQGFTGDFLMPDGEVLVETDMYIPGFYQGRAQQRFLGQDLFELSITSHHEPWSYPMDAWPDDHNLSFSVYEEGVSFSEERLTSFDEQGLIDVQSDGVRTSYEVAGERIDVKVHEPWFRFLQAAGTHDVDLVVAGGYEGQEARYTSSVEVGDTGWFMKYGIYVIYLLLILLVIWYVYRLVTKKRFVASKMRIEQEIEDKRNGFSRGKKRTRTANFKTNWLTKWLLPTKAEKKTIFSMTFIAQSSSAVYLAKQSQHKDLIVGSMKLDDQAKRQDLVIMDSDQIKIQTDRKHETYTFKAS